MKSKAKVAVIGGGVVGVSTLYHLAKKGWNDVVLVERKELTSGSTWHAAGLLPLFNMSYSVGQLHKYAVNFYKTLEKETGQSVGFSVVSNIRLATTQDRMDEYHQYAGVAQTIGVDVKFLTPEQVKEIWPLCNIDGIIGAIQHPEDGYIQPADLTQALAKGARDMGAEIYRNTNVVGVEQNSGETWTVKTDKGDIQCEHVVSATGNFARQTGKMVGLEIPVIPVEHQYIVTESHPEIQKRKEQGLPEMGVLRDSDSSWYMREEAGGLILGPYEKGAPVCYVNGPGKDSEFELFQEDLERIEKHIESAIHRVPIFGEVGVKKVYNGAICYTPDGSPIVGPAWGLKNFWINEGHSFGITAAGGAGWQLGEWIVDGEPTIDMLGVDPRRFGDYATDSYLIEKNEEAYANVFTIHYPDEEREAGRPLRQAPCHDRLKDLGAVFGQKFGWERANWFAPKSVIQEDDWSFRRSSWFEHVGNECRHVQENVGLLDMTAFAKCRISGPGAEEYLDNLVANNLPKKIGRVNLCHALNTKGGVHSEFTIAKEKENSFYLVSAGAFQRLDHDWMFKWMPKDRSVTFENLTNSIGVLVLAGPKARDLMQSVSSSADFSNEKFPWLSAQQIDVGLAPTIAMRMNFVGELGWELHHPIEYQNHIFDALMKAGEDFNLKPFGIRAMDSLRIEKSYKLIGTEMSIEYAAMESGLDRFVHLNKGNFIGRDALVAWQQKGFQNQFVTLEVKDVKDADVLGNNPIYKDDEVVGRATGGNYGFRVQKSLALAMISPEFSKVGTKLSMDILGKKYDIEVIEDSPYDPENNFIRAKK
ncbi:MAG: GcvT family protein [Pelagibacteraceae bacterium]|jgi:dimethylglycine dehydrogenase|nr:GcvT family protein [Pelagibacteraceae bacterium]MDP6783964.1 FAD-dependent oxidoreductase [Alphaproteobacteria bacterium]MBO6467251.1 GcvT family protein [Pelagibacteraceae bacterium]MBO6470021.1 GcvT family protein [Pelagibacteraceae bacterium]MBO6471166.1 GcvT family protein [Pelagibacteraceae bacterium]